MHDRMTLAPAADLASKVALLMRERYILISTDGPLHNVLKFKPPIIFSKSNVDQLVHALDEVFLICSDTKGNSRL